MGQFEKRMEELQKKKTAAEQRVIDAKKRIDELVQQRKSEQRSSNREVAVTLDKLKAMVESAARKSADKQNASAKSGTAAESNPTQAMPASPGGSKVYIRLPNGKFIPPELAPLWLNYVERRGTMSQQERDKVEALLEDGAIDRSEIPASSKP